MLWKFLCPSSFRSKLESGRVAFLLIWALGANLSVSERQGALRQAKENFSRGLGTWHSHSEEISEISLEAEALPSRRNPGLIQQPKGKESGGGPRDHTTQP